MNIIRLVILVLISINSSLYALKKDDCSVCFGVLERFIGTLSDSEKSDVEKIEQAFKNFCKATTSRESTFCYYVGGSENSATSILREISSRIVSHFPVDKICERISGKYPDICNLRYEKVIDLKTVDLKKLKVKDLKNILNQWDEVCTGCVEKSEFIAKIEEVKPKYTREEL